MARSIRQTMAVPPPVTAEVVASPRCPSCGSQAIRVVFSGGVLSCDCMLCEKTFTDRPYHKEVKTDEQNYV